MRIQHNAHTDVGRRSNNEDAYVAAPHLGFYAVADGMGGYEGGEIASQLALDTLLAYIERLGADGIDLEEDEEGALAQVRMAIRMADREIARRAVGRLAQMGTTVACMLVRGSRAILAHVGDSRVYRLRDGELSLLTRDHSLVAEMEAAGLSVAAHMMHVITQALGSGPPAQPDIRVIDVLPGDRYLICSDGVHDVLTPRDLVLGLSRARGAARAIVDTAYDVGSHDNLTALVLRAR